MLKTAIAALATVGLTEARVTQGRCPLVVMMEDLDFKRYAGKWYEWRRDYWNSYT